VADVEGVGCYGVGSSRCQVTRSGDGFWANRYRLGVDWEWEFAVHGSLAEAWERQDAGGYWVPMPKWIGLLLGSRAVSFPGNGVQVPRISS
jgi:hypothetical protein